MLKIPTNAKLMHENVLHFFLIICCYLCVESCFSMSR